MPLPRSAFSCCCVVSKGVLIIVQVQVHNDHIYRELSLLHSRAQMVPDMNTGHLEPGRTCLVTLKVCTAHCCARHDHYRIQQQDCHLSFSYCYFVKKNIKTFHVSAPVGARGRCPSSLKSCKIFLILQNIYDILQNIIYILQNIIDILQNTLDILQNIIDFLQNLAKYNKKYVFWGKTFQNL